MMITLSDETLTVTGVQIVYYMICRRKLWLFSHHIQMEQNSQQVALGSILHEQSYSRKRKEIQLGPIKIDFFEKNRARISEIKKSKAMEDAHFLQMKYYLYYLKILGIEVEGRINYPLLRKTKSVRLEPGDKKILKTMLTGIKNIVDSEHAPSVERKNICKKCSYYEFCFV